MAIEIKDQVTGSVRKAGSAAATNTGVALGATALGLSVLNGGLGILNGGLTGVANAGGNGLVRECLVDKDMFYQTLLDQVNTQAERDINTERRFANLEASIAINSTANQYQNTIIHNQFEWERLLSEKNLALATCRCIQGQVYLPPSMLADSYVSPTRVLESHEARPYREGWGHGGGGCNPCYGGF